MEYDIKKREITLKQVTTPCSYFFWGIIITNLGALFLLVFPDTHDFRKMLQSFLSRFVIPFLIFVKIPYAFGKGIIKCKKIIRTSYIIFLRIICVILGSIVIVGFLLTIYNQFVSPTDPIWLSNLILNFNSKN